MKKFHLLKESVNEIKEKRVYYINVDQLRDEDLDEYLKTIIEKWMGTITQLPSDFKLPNIPIIDYDITYREDL
jgi:hypothetical protein